jgi:PBSX family phage terminase large subunit
MSKKEAKLTIKQELFCRYYVKYRNATRAAIEAGYSAKTADVIGIENLGKPMIKYRIYDLKQESYKFCNITVEKLLEENATIAFSNLADYVDTKGNLTDFGDVDTRALSEISFDNMGKPKLKLHSKVNTINRLLDELKGMKADQIGEEFYDLDNIALIEHFKPWFNEKYEQHLFSILKGGRASGKSTTASRRLVKDILMYPINILILRKIHSTIATSVYEEIKQAINDLNVSDEFRCIGGTKPSITRIRTGQRFIFTGGQEPEKIKSIKTSKFPIARLWIEELVEFRSYEEVKTIIDSIVRATLPEGLVYHIIFTYNPPKRKAHWCNKLYNTQFIPENTCIDHSTSFVNPHLSKDFLDEADNVKAKNEARWRWNYGGEAIGGGIVPFSNLEFREITDIEIFTFDNLCQGLDWGYAADPLCFLRAHFDKTRFILYIFAEIYQVKISNKILSEKIIEKGYNDIMIIADSEDPRSIDDVKSYGIRCRGATKGPGSVEHGLEWLDTLQAIVIDPVRCPNAAREFENIDYQTDKDGNVISKLDDKDDHSIDCTRYLTERFQYSKRKFFPSRR